MTKVNLGDLTGNLNSGEGIVKFGDFFARLSPLMRTDLLRDWLYDITEAYKEARSEWYTEMGVEYDLEKMESANGKG